MTEVTLNITYLLPRPDQQRPFIVIRARVPIVRLMAQHLIALLSEDNAAEEEVYRIMQNHGWKEYVVPLDDFRLGQAFAHRRGGFAHRHLA